MRHYGDYAPATVLYFMFTTYRPSTGAAYTLAGTPVVRVYKNGSTTQHTTTYSVTADFDTITGLNYFTIDTSADGTFYAAGGQFSCVLEAGTVDSVSVVGTVVATFSLNATAALRPTTAGRTLDVSAGGEAGIDWANVGSPTTAVDLSGTNIKTNQKVDVETIKTQAVATTGAGTITFPGAATLASTTNITAGTIATVSGNVNGSVNSVTTGVSIANGAITTTTFGAGAIDAAAIATNAIGASELATDAAEEIADTILGRNVAGGSNTGRLVKEALYPLRNKVAIVAGTMTVYQTDDLTSSWTATVGTAATDPINSITPA